MGERGSVGRLGYDALMDDITSDKVVYWITQFWSFFGVVAGVYLGGEATKRIMGVLGYGKLPEEQRPVAYRIWESTLPWHPFLVGSLCGLIPGVPAATWVPDAWPARMLWFGIAGAVSGQLYEAFKKSGQQLPGLIRAIVAKKLGVSLPPPESSSAQEPSSSSESSGEGGS